jgi:CubicO group peptidase (beta-lactamase class C family)
VNGTADDETRPPPADVAWRVIEAGARHGAYGGAVALVDQGGRTLLRRALGSAILEPEPRPMAPETVFDLASLTKVIATLPAILRLVDAGALRLDDPLSRILPEVGQDGAKRRVTIRRLLTHSAGLTAWLPLYLDHEGPDAYLAAIAASQPETEPGARVVYSDLGFILLGETVRRLTGHDVAAFAAREIFAPLGMTDTGYLPTPDRRSRAAATERGNATERAMCGDRAAAFGRWRTGVIRGEVHDGNAWYGLGGVGGHAGLFGVADDLVRYGRLWLNGGEGLHGRVLSSDLVAVLLTNRLYPEPRTEFEPVRRAFHAALAKE